MSPCATFRVLAFLLIPIVAGAQPRWGGEWSLAAHGGYCTGVSPAMRGTLASLAAEFPVAYRNSTFPFGDKRAVNIGLGGDLSFRPLGWNITPFVAFESGFFTAGDGYATPTTAAALSVGMLMVGAECALGTRADRWNAFGRAGIGLAAIVGRIDHEYYYSTDLTPAIRAGVEVAAGGRYNLETAPLAVEASVAYSNANVLGKHFIEPRLLEQSNILKERALNDGADPADASDRSRTIDFLSFRLGGRIWF